MFEGFEMPDTTTYMLLGRSGKGSSNIVLRLDTIAYPRVTREISTVPCLRTTGNANASQESYDLIAKSNVKREIFLPEVTVQTRYIPQTEYEVMTKIDGMSIKEKALMKEGSKSVLDMLKTMPLKGIMYNFNLSWFVYRGWSTGLVIDGTHLCRLKTARHRCGSCPMAQSYTA